MEERDMKMSWGKFAAMIATSVVLMFFLMYQLVYSSDQVLSSLNRLVPSIASGCAMAVVMLAFMWSMYAGKRTKIAVVVVAAIVGASLLALNRSQAAVSDVLFMRP